MADQPAQHQQRGGASDWHTSVLTTAMATVSPSRAAHIVKSDGNVLQGYNGQAVVDGDHLVPMLERTIANTSQVPKTLIADAGYWSEDNAKACEDRGVDPHIATGRLPHGQPPPPIRGPSWRPSEWCNSPGPQPGVAGLSVRTSGDRLHG